MSTADRRIVVWRHASTAWNREKRFQGSSDVPLDDGGLQQAESAARELAKLEPTVLVTSDSQRAMQTATPLCRRLEIEPIVDARLQEADLGEWEGLTREQVAERFPDEYAAWRRGTDIARGGGETYRQVAERGAAAMSDALTGLDEGQTLVAVTHGSMARATVGRLLGLDAALWRNLGTLGHGRWARLKEVSYGWRLADFNARPLRRE